MLLPRTVHGFGSYAAESRYLELEGLATMTVVVTGNAPEGARQGHDAPVDAVGPPPPGHHRWAPTLGHAKRVFEPSFSGTGLTFASWFFALSLTPSLLPRSGYVQGIASGVTVMVGYGLGASLQWVWDYLEIPKPTGRVRTVIVRILVALGLWAAVFGGWRLVGWQNEIRGVYGMEPVSPTVWPVIIVVTFIVANLVLVVARSVRLLFQTVIRFLGRLLPRRLAVVLGTSVLLLVMWLLWSGVLVNGFFAATNALFAPRDTTLTLGVAQPAAPERSGSPQSLTKWEQLGRQGRSFVASGPTVADLDAANGGGAKEPIRVYVGLASADTVQRRADLLLQELKRTGAFNRKILVVATTTGTGFLDMNGVDPIEYIWNGDTAIAGVQYSYLPSWISLLADQDAVRETSRTVFDTVHGYWSTLPAASRPRLYLYGLSLGSLGVESILSSMNVINEPIDGALMVGPTFVNELHSRLIAQREPGTAPWLPVYEKGRTVRFTAEQDGFAQTPGPWGPTRIVYLQHASDPVVFFSPSLAFSRPDWILDGQRGPDVSERMGWFPVVTMWQVLLDLPGAGSIPMGYGHLYSATANLTSWVQVSNPPGWSAARTAHLAKILEARPYRN
ncbi:membrane protein [Intrasporangium oryzae NRRL B-24470]|uniref:Membrane protein n=1 Tax=Intrasporangium oryzae NRRL B-24470 TaxID=1386089 RepID=W9G5Y9_9MICO|nr:alpha/beta-hydrolase family protein [Intrasporangium oryzae]EWT00727.1 membrane protein [Intrasporangium oryzae NRRL B-24470]